MADWNSHYIDKILSYCLEDIEITNPYDKKGMKFVPALLVRNILSQLRLNEMNSIYIIFGKELYKNMEYIFICLKIIMLTELTDR